MTTACYPLRKALFLACVVASIQGCAPDGNTVSPLPRVVDYNEHVRPILSDKCFACHGPDEANREAGLRLDVAEAAYAELPESPGKRAIVPGKPSRSQLVARIRAGDPEEQMPPVDANLTLDDHEKALLTRWIDQGAVYKPLWSLIPPESTSRHSIEQSSIPDEIDRLVEKRLKAEGLSPATRATRETLIRRAAFDLTGLPPTLEEINAFLADERPDAYERVIDTYLEAPAYGERMAAMWMDVARYADSDGYLDDKHRELSPWRDWVIRAFNENLPYDQFVTWQLAGDLLPNPTQDQVLATAFNRLHKKNSEAGIVFEEFRTEYVADRANTFGKAFLGLTMECARCHDHKYDPISQADYYKLYGYFNSTDEIGHAVYGPDQTPGPALLLTTPEEDQEVSRLKRDVEQLEKELETVRRAAKASNDAWLEHLPSISAIQKRMAASLEAHYPFDNIIAQGDAMVSPNVAGDRSPATIRDIALVEGKSGKAIHVTDYGQMTLGERVGWYGRTQPFTIDFWIYPDTVYSEAMLFTHSEEWRLGLRGYTLQLEDNHLVFRMAHSYPQNAIKVVAESMVPVRTWTHVTITYDGSSKAQGVRLFQDGLAVSLDTKRDNLYKGILFTPDIHTYGFRGIELGQRDKFTPFKDGRIDAFRVYDAALTPIEVLTLHDPNRVSQLLAEASEGKMAGEERALLAEYHAVYHGTPAPVVARLNAARDSLNTLLNGIEEIMVMGDLAEPRPTHVLERGLYDAPGDRVAPGTPAAILPIAEDLPENRLGLAAWLFDPENPLTARVMVNRIWQMHFGRGLVATPDDFGNQGALPSHPALLDALAVAFRESGWDIKQLHKTIMRSATYQQASAMTPEGIERDPDNVLLARGPAFRLPAEMIRDHALAISGLLVPRIGGPSVYPYQPAGLWDDLSTKGWRYRYLQEPGEGLYRRSLYTIWKRTAPPPSMLLFDAPDRSTCMVERQPTSTPLQALTLLNDPQYVEAARVLAETVMAEQPTQADRFTTIFRLITSRHPTEAEMGLMESMYQDEQRLFYATPQKALAYLNTGEHPLNQTLNPIQTAALASVTSALLNTDEATTRR